MQKNNFSKENNKGLGILKKVTWLLGAFRVGEYT